MILLDTVPYTHTCTHTYVHTHMYTHMYTHTWYNMYTHVHTYTYLNGWGPEEGTVEDRICGEASDVESYVVKAKAHHTTTIAVENNLHIEKDNGHM